MVPFVIRADGVSRDDVELRGGTQDLRRTRFVDEPVRAPLESRSGADAVPAAYLETLEGRVGPDVGLILSL